MNSFSIHKQFATMATSSHSFRLFFGLILLFCSSTPWLLQAQEPMAYAPSLWTNGASLNNIGTLNGYVRSILLLDNHFTSNSNSKPSVACGFICTKPCDVFLFSIFFVETGRAGVSYLGNPLSIWSANQYNPVGENATVQFTDDGNLALFDANGTSVWSTGTSGSSAVGIKVTEAGNLVLFDRDNKTVWQSRDHPAYSLFLGQELREGQKLRRNQFYATVLDDGLYAFVDLKPPQITCSRRNDVPSTNGNSHVRYTDSKLMLYPSDDESEPVLLTPLVPAESKFQFMSLQENGGLQIFDWRSGWDITGDVFDGLNCYNPFVCGEYGISSSNGQCTCLGNDDGKGSYFKYIDAARPELGCSPVNRLDCGAMQDHGFLNLTEVAYFSYNDVQAAAFNGTDEWSCVQACSRNCSCKAALFMYYQDATDGYCFLPSQLYSLQRMDPEKYSYSSTAHIKIQLTSEKKVAPSPNPSPNSATKVAHSPSPNAATKVAPSPSPSPNAATKEEPLKKRTNVAVVLSSNVAGVLGSVLGAVSFLLISGVV